LPSVLIVVLATAPAASALSSGFVGEITTVVQDTLGLGVGVGATVKGDYAHSDCADPFCRAFYNPTETSGLYYDLGVVVDMLVGPVAVGWGTFMFQSDIGIDRPPLGDDSYDVSADFPDASVSPEPAGLDIDYWSLSFRIDLQDDDGTVFDYGYIPAQLPPLNRFEEATFSVSLFAALLDEQGDPAGGALYEATGEILHLPEPSSAVLAGLGLAGISAWRRRRLPGMQLR
jgi:hypothetical protein